MPGCCRTACCSACPSSARPLPGRASCAIARATFSVAEGEGGRLLGFGNCGPQRDPSFGFGGEIYTLYVLPDAQGGGLGRQLLLALFARLLHCGHGSAMVWVVRANPARFFYERLGGKLALHRAIPVGGQAVEAAGYGWSDLNAVLQRAARSGARF